MNEYFECLPAYEDCESNEFMYFIDYTSNACSPCINNCKECWGMYDVDNTSPVMMDCYICNSGYVA